MPDATHIHVHPIGDLVEHDTSGEDCVCGPDWEFQPDGGVVITHYSLDNREADEPDA